MSNFSCHSEFEMESSKVHHSELSYSTDSERYAENNREHFELLKKDPEYCHFFRDFPTLTLGKKISKGGQAEIYEACLQPNAPFDLVVKVMMGDGPLEAFQSQWPVGMLSAHSKFKQLFDLPLITILGGTLLKDARFAFVMYRRWSDLRLLIDRRRKHTSSSPFPIEQTMELMRSIAEDMRTLHEKHDILHRDLKASNVLVWGHCAEDVSLVSSSNPSEKINIVVADFECSVGVLGTGLWRAPEILQQLRDRVRGTEVKFTWESDVYSYGMMCYEIVTGCLPFDGVCNKEMILKVIGGLRPELPEDLPEFLRDIIVECWSSDPSERPNFSELCVMLKNRRGPNLVIVSVDNEIHKDATVFKVKQRINSQPLALLELIQKLIDLDLCLWEAARLFENLCYFYQDFMVTDGEGRKICDKEVIEHIKKVLRMPMKIKWITDSVERSKVQLSNIAAPFARIQLSGRSRPGLLADVSTELDEMGCKVSIVGVWTHKGGSACVIHVACHANVGYAKMGCLWERLFPILQGHDNEQVVERVAAAEFPLMERNVVFDFSLSTKLSGSSFVHIHLEKTERGNDTLIAHVIYANFTSGQNRLKSCCRVLECCRVLQDCGYGVRKARIYLSARQKILLGKTGKSYEDIDLNPEGSNTQIVREALERHSVQNMELSITGDRVELIEDLLQRFHSNGLSMLRADMSHAHEITLYVGDPGDSSLLEHVLPHRILKDRYPSISYPKINLWTHQ